MAFIVSLFVRNTGPGAARPEWYRFFTVYILQNVAHFVAGLLCIRNGLSRRMPSGSQVWLLMGIALIAYLIGNFFFASWELGWQLNPVGSLGDPFFCIFYICLSLAMLIAIASKRVQLKIYQWLIVAGVAMYAATIVFWILKPPAASLAATVPEASAPTMQVQGSETNANSLTASTASTAPTVTEPVSEPQTTAPEWVMFFDGILKPYGQTLNVFYVWCDVILFALAVVMILAFWGGRLSNAWQVNAQAIICFYIADMWLAYAANQIKDYQSGFMLEVFWTLGSIQFAVAAGIEFEHMLARKKGIE